MISNLNMQYLILMYKKKLFLFFFSWYVAENENFGRSRTMKGKERMEAAATCL